MARPDSQWTGLHEISYLGFLIQFVKHFQFWLRQDKSNRTLSDDSQTFEIDCNNTDQILCEVQTGTYKTTPNLHTLPFTQIKSGMGSFALYKISGGNISCSFQKKYKNSLDQWHSYDSWAHMKRLLSL
jgi:hypothetical protein